MYRKMALLVLFGVSVSQKNTLKHCAGGDQLPSLPREKPLVSYLFPVSHGKNLVSWCLERAQGVRVDAPGFCGTMKGLKDRLFPLCKTLQHSCSSFRRFLA